MMKEPKWSSGYPVKRDDERRVTRRQFAAFCGCSALAMGAAAVAKGKFFALPEGEEALEVAGDGEIPEGGYKLFNYPTPDHPCILVRLEGGGGYAAFSQSCTHLMCPVYFEAASRRLVCPCHEGFFDAGTGDVIAGPPQRPLPRYAVEVVDGMIRVGPGVMNGG